jgi:hypothetical protein
MGMTRTQTASERITAEVTSWPGVEAGSGSRGEFGFRVGGHEIGHLHGDRSAHFGFPREIGAELREQGRVGPHPVNRHSTKMAARQIESEADIEEVIALMRLNYDRVAAL